MITKKSQLGYVSLMASGKTQAGRSVHTMLLEQSCIHHAGVQEPSQRIYCNHHKPVSWENVPSSVFTPRPSSFHNLFSSFPSCNYPSSLRFLFTFFFDPCSLRFFFYFCFLSLSFASSPSVIPCLLPLHFQSGWCNKRATMGASGSCHDQRVTSAK